MIKRWLIRGIFILPTLFIAFGWLWSVTHSTDFILAKHFTCGSWWGVIDLSYLPEFDLDPVLSHSPNGEGQYFPDTPTPMEARQFMHLGFGYSHFPHGFNGNQYQFSMPYWFFALIFGGLLWVAWRKTRPVPAPAASHPPPFAVHPVIRWLVCGLFAGVIMLSIAGWLWSGLRYTSLGHNNAQVNSMGGVVGFIYFPGPGTAPWNFADVSNGKSGLNLASYFDRIDFSVSMEEGIHLYAFGLGYFHSPGLTGVEDYEISIPYWFPMLLAGGGLLVTWFKTRPKPDPATAFPVQAAKA